MVFMKNILPVTLLAIGTALPVSATTATFDVEVTQSTLTQFAGGPSATLPALGTIGTVTLSLPGIDASNTTLFSDPDFAPNLGSVSASINVGGLFASLQPGAGSIAFASDTQLRFANGSFSQIDVDFPRDASATPTYAGSFRLETPADGFTPTTFGDVAAALTDPDATLFFSFNGTTFDGIDTFFRANSIAPAPVPLPAGGLLLLSGLGGIAAFKRRKKHAA